MFTQEEIIEMARQAGFYDHLEMYFDAEMLEAFAKLVDAKATAKEREACAQVCEGFEGQHRYVDDIVEAIRAREQQ